MTKSATTATAICSTRFAWRFHAEARGKGVLVTLHEEIHSAREVVKTNQRPGGFQSLGRGMLGHIEEDQVSFYYAPTRRHTFRSEFDMREIQRAAARRRDRRLRRR